ncbi:Methyltransferase type 11 [Emticicia oligotrophica DSM 17448]|uniref:Methyltransferase type 11 n=1 Tax=Emticicia oligotrophica (strain DSM 17448 / CIP 109782 / MTCC 6937 / GPTSA100-15) TaxID=929562 RepID=A0ABM5N2X4_EMTOG|nr:class I SAM-dependent methyltransferase [Emticicia oligotrophica]AFK03716.1 Methyltransferase type 11 [Emticicia oligotrophica DSM 17448]
MNRESYNKIAEIWAEHRHSSFVSQIIVDFAEKLSLNAKVLDIGCGTGMPVAGYLASKGLLVTGIDFAEKMIEIAQSQQIPQTQFLVSDFFDFETKETFDGILAWDSFFHFPKEKQAMIYPKVARLLNSGGYLLFTHGDDDGEHTNPMMGEEFYYSAILKEDIIQLLEANGCEVIDMIKDYREKDTHRGLVVLAQKK